MPSPQILDFSPIKKGPTPLENTLTSFANRFRENQIEKQDTDILKDVFARYKQDGKDIESAVIDATTRPGISPTARVNAVNSLLNLKKMNNELLKQENVSLKRQAVEEKNKRIEEEKKLAKAEKEKTKQEKVDTKAQKDVEKANKELQKAQKEAEVDQLEVDFLDDIADQNLKPTDIYKQARAKGIPRVRAQGIATLHRMEGKEGRLTEADITKQYDFELRELDRDIKNAGADEDAKKPIRAERNKLKQQRKEDLAKFRRGEREFTLAMHAEEMAKQEVDQAVEREKEFKESLVKFITEKLPAGSVPKGTKKWLLPQASPDGKKHQFEWDGNKWLLLS